MGIKTLVPKPQTSGNKALGMFDKVVSAIYPARMSIGARPVSELSGVSKPSKTVS
jgi:hypothetical protein